MKILITGSRGFMGGSVGRFAARAGHEVLGIGRASQAEADWPGGYVQADVSVSDLSGLIREFAPDALLHAAGTASVGASFRAPLDDLRAAVITWANTLDSVRRSGLRPLLLFPSSAAVYGHAIQLPLREEAVQQSISPYGFHKAACELLAGEYAECYGLRVVVCRLFSVFGERQRRLLVWEIYRQLSGTDETVWLEGTGAETRDYLHADDAASALLHLMEERQDADTGRSLTVNVASGEETRVNDLAAQLRDLVAPQKEIRSRNVVRPGDPPRWCADISRLRALAPAWQPQPLANSLARCVAAWRQESA